MQESGFERWTHPAVLLVATDLSDLDRLMPFALKEAIETGARLILLHVMPAGTGMAIDPIGMPYYDPAAALEFSAKTLDPWCRLAREKHRPTRDFLEMLALPRPQSRPAQAAARPWRPHPAKRDRPAP